MRKAIPLVVGLLCAAQLSAFSVIPMVQHATCGAATGSINVYAEGGAWPYTYLWNTGSTDAYLGDLAPGIYTVTATDANSETATLDVEVYATTGLFAPMSAMTVWGCEEDCSASLYQNYLGSSGESPFTTVVDPPGPLASFGPSYASISAMCSNNTYTFTVTDINGCTGVYGPVIITDPVIPEILSTTITPSCPGGNTGSMTVAYDQMDSLYIIGPDQSWYAPIENPFTITNLAPGQYVLNATVIQDDLPWGVYGSYCYHSDTLIVPETTEPCGSLSGTVFADVDDDCAQSGGEPGLAYRVLAIEPGGYLDMTDVDGNYGGAYPFSTYGLDESLDDYTSDCVALPAPFTLNAGTPSITIDLPLSPTFGPDLAAYLWMGGHVPGDTATYYLSVQNAGPYSFTDVTLDLDFEDYLTFLSADGSPVLVSAGHLQWSLPSIAAFSSFQFQALVLVPTTTAIGTPVIGTASIGLTEPDAQPDNDAYTATRNVTSSYDPNDKVGVTSSRLSTSSYYLDADSYVDYTIRFQNTGTSEAMNVYLLDTISTLLDLTSFNILAASHDFTASLGDARDLRFDFPNIMLPDSGSDMAGSQGFISFRLKPVSTINLGEELVNAADIFFDFNEPVRTNDAVLLVEHLSGVTETQKQVLSIFPNPVTDVLWLDLPNGIQRIDLFSADGRLAHSSTVSTANAPVNVRDLPAGVYNVRATDGSGDVRHARFVKR